jgi:alkylation response protein AidB-like acyl-CoA dehydrogenase
VSSSGAIRAVKHLCAQLSVRAGTACSAVQEAAVRGARDCLQVHGGTGFTGEADVYPHLKRACVRAHRGGVTTHSEVLSVARLAA